MNLVQFTGCALTLVLAIGAATNDAQAQAAAQTAQLPQSSPAYMPTVNSPLRDLLTNSTTAPIVYATIPALRGANASQLGSTTLSAAMEAAPEQIDQAKVSCLDTRLKANSARATCPAAPAPK